MLASRIEESSTNTIGGSTACSAAPSPSFAMKKLRLIESLAALTLAGRDDPALSSRNDSWVNPSTITLTGLLDSPICQINERRLMLTCECPGVHSSFARVQIIYSFS